jgi:enoyl-CoA hydratase
MSVRKEHVDRVGVITIDRPQARNALDPDTAHALYLAIAEDDADRDVDVMILTGTGETFCAGADLKAVAAGARFEHWRHGPMGPSRMALTKPLIAAVEGHAVAGGLELALLADLRIASETAVFGVFCRRWGVPLIDGGTARLPRIIGQGRALDMILTGRPVGAQEALAWGLANRVTPPGQALSAALELAQGLRRFPQTCLRVDRASALAAFDTPLPEALLREGAAGQAALLEAQTGAARFADGRGRGGDFDSI